MARSCARSNSPSGYRPPSVTIGANYAQMCARHGPPAGWDCDREVGAKSGGSGHLHQRSRYVADVSSHRHALCRVPTGHQHRPVQPAPCLDVVWMCPVRCCVCLYMSSAMKLFGVAQREVVGDPINRLFPEPLSLFIQVLSRLHVSSLLRAMLCVLQYKHDSRLCA